MYARKAWNQMQRVAREMYAPWCGAKYASGCPSFMGQREIAYAHSMRLQGCSEASWTVGVRRGLPDDDNENNKQQQRSIIIKSGVCPAVSG